MRAIRYHLRYSATPPKWHGVGVTSYPVRTLFWACLCSLALSLPAVAEEYVWTTGRVLSADGRRPVAGAMVAVYDRRSRVVDYAKTDENGEYALAVPRSAMNLPGRSGGFLHQVSKAFGGVGRVAGAPIKAGIRAAGSLANASDPITRAGVGAVTGIASAIVDSVVGSNKKREELKRNQPGVVVVKVAAPGHNTAVALARVFWMQQELYEVAGRRQQAVVAWLDPARLAAEGDERVSSISSEYLSFTDARVSPGIAMRGQEVTLSVTLPAPPNPSTPVIVVARNSATRKTYQLLPIGGDRYQCKLTVDNRFPLHDQVFAVLAYPEATARSGRNPAAEKAIERSGLWDPSRPFVFDPLHIASRNRAELVLTVVAPPGR